MADLGNKKEPIFLRLNEIREAFGQVRAADLLEFKSTHSLTDSQILDLVDEHVLRQGWMKNSTPEVLLNFFGVLQEQFQSKKIFEYGAYGSSFGARLLDKWPQLSLTYSAHGDQFSVFFEKLFENGSEVLGEVDLAHHNGKYDVVLCDPPLGMKHLIGKGQFDESVVQNCAKLVSDRGLLIWLTARNVQFVDSRRSFVANLKTFGLSVLANIDVPSGAFSNASSIPGVLLVFSRKEYDRKLVANVREVSSHVDLIRSLLNPKNHSDGKYWRWIACTDDRTFAHLEYEASIAEALPKGIYNLVPLQDLVAESESFRTKADKDLDADASYIFLPEMPRMDVSISIDDLKTPARNWAIQIDRNKVRPDFLSWVFNSNYGRLERERLSVGATILRLNRGAISQLNLPIPDLKSQNLIMELESKSRAMTSYIEGIQAGLASDWSKLSTTRNDLDRLVSGTDVRSRLENWHNELPYPLATIYRRYITSKDPKEGFEALLHFYEVAAVFFATLGLSYVKRLSGNREIQKWLIPSSGATLKRTDFNFWIDAASGSLKKISSILRNKVKTDEAKTNAGTVVVENARFISQFRKVRVSFEAAKKIRNNTKGHGGFVKKSDAEIFKGQLEKILIEFFSEAQSVFQKCTLVKGGPLNYLENNEFDASIELLKGSDPQLETKTIRVSSPFKTGGLGFWFEGSTSICPALPFFKFSTSQIDERSTVYVYNRQEKEGLRWVSFDRASDQEIFEDDADILTLLESGE